MASGLSRVKRKIPVSPRLKYAIQTKPIPKTSKNRYKTFMRYDTGIFAVLDIFIDTYTKENKKPSSKIRAWRWY